MTGFYRLVPPTEIADARGRITLAERDRQIPFDVRRAFVLHDVQSDAIRGGHAHRRAWQWLWMIQGACRARMDDGATIAVETLVARGPALLVAPAVWLSLDQFTSDGACLVLSPEPYGDADYLRDRAEFDRLVEAARGAAAAGREPGA